MPITVIVITIRMIDNHFNDCGDNGYYHLSLASPASLHLGPCLAAFYGFPNGTQEATMIQ